MKTLANILALAADLVPGVTMVLAGLALAVAPAFTDMLWY